MDSSRDRTSNAQEGLEEHAEAPTKVRGSGTLRLSTEEVALPRVQVTVEREAGKSNHRTVVIDGDTCRVGSHPSNDVVVADPLVSRFHCQLSRDGDAWKLSDLGSLNGTFALGFRVRDADLPRGECRLTLGDSVLVISECTSAERADVPFAATFGDMYGTSVGMRKLFAQIARVAQSDVSVLIQGESGTGKEVVAREIVRRGPREEKPLVVVDCGAVSASMIESELFGHVRGSFPGADSDRIGAFEQAEGGTLFLDEIGELPLALQPKLLRALQTHELRRVGENRTRKVDVRILASTNRRLEREVNHGRFREDLYFRLSVVRLSLPPLRDRLEDLAALIHLFLVDSGATEHAHLFTTEVIASMASHRWTGNLRELRNYVERSVVLQTAGRPVSSIPPPLGALSVEVTHDLDVPFTTAKEEIVTAFERQYLSALLAWAKGNVSLAARKGGMDRVHLHRLMARHRLRE